MSGDGLEVGSGQHRVWPRGTVPESVEMFNAH